MDEYDENEHQWAAAGDAARNQVARWSHMQKVKFLEKHEWGNRGHWDLWFQPDTGWSFSLHDGAKAELRNQIYRKKTEQGELF